jgi:hypothetical protein
MRPNEKELPIVFESTDLTNLVGIQPLYLNKLFEREQFGITASVRTGKGRGSRRLFAAEDVFGIALVWWLFESGLRSLTIQYVLNQICGGPLHSRANDAARILLERENKMLVIERIPRTQKDLKRAYPVQLVHLYDEFRTSELVGELTAVSVLVIPVGNLYSNLKMKMGAP